MDPTQISTLIWTVVYAFLGVIVFGGAFWVSTKVTPFSVRKEIEDDQNVALAIILGAVILGLSIIIASAISS